MNGSYSSITTNAKRILDVLIGEGALGPSNRLSRDEVFDESKLDLNSFNLSYDFLRSQMYVAAPISEREMWATASGVEFLANNTTPIPAVVKVKLDLKLIVEVFGIVVAIVVGIFGVTASTHTWIFKPDILIVDQIPTSTTPAESTAVPKPPTIATLGMPDIHPPLVLNIEECQTLDKDEIDISLRIDGFFVDQFGSATASITIKDARQSGDAKFFRLDDWYLVDEKNELVHEFRFYRGASHGTETTSPGDTESGSLEFRGALPQNAEIISIVAPPFSRLMIDLPQEQC
ncbi:MAG: hypothetical protein HQ475_11365 [SAR202 cluster bacterium]|nr:hypothetical protein [SAR202 cluster bacterium]